MTSLQDQYTESLRSSQEAVVKAMESWTKSAQTAFGTPEVSSAGKLDPDVVIDQVFDFAEQMLKMQRRFTKTLTATAAEAAAKASKGS